MKKILSMLMLVVATVVITAANYPATMGNFESRPIEREANTEFRLEFQNQIMITQLAVVPIGPLRLTEICNECADNWLYGCSKLCCNGPACSWTPCPANSCKRIPT
jgi:hypothetical protein